MKRQVSWLVWVIGFLLFAVIISLNLSFTTFLQYLLLGLPQGAIIALIAVGYSMVYGIIQLINFAHGEVFMLSTYFIIMLMAPAQRSSGTAQIVISVTIGLLVMCTAWVVTQNMRRQSGRVLIAGIAGVVFAFLNYVWIPRGAAPVLPLAIAYVLAIFYTCCLGVTMDLVAYRPLRSSPRLIALITAIGVSLFLSNFAQSIWGSQALDLPKSAKPAFLSGAANRIRISQRLDIAVLDVLVVVLAVGLMVALQLFIHKTRTGKAMRACAQDRVTASLMGIRVDRVVALAFAIGAALAAAVAPLYVLRGSFITPTMGYIVGILAFSSAVLGGIGNITGAMLGGTIIGIVYGFVPLFNVLPSFKWFQSAEQMGWVTTESYQRLVAGYGQPAQYQLGVAYLFMIIVIVLKPTGLLGRASAKRA